MRKTASAEIAIVGIDIGKNSFHVVGHDGNGSIILRQKWSRGQIESRLANLPPCLIGMEACVGAHHLARKLISLGHDARLMPARYVRPYGKGQKNDFNDAEAIAEAVRRPRCCHRCTTTVTGRGSCDRDRGQIPFKVTLLMSGCEAGDILPAAPWHAVAKAMTGSCHTRRGRATLGANAAPSWSATNSQCSEVVM
jgi:hypothetical protein